MAYRCNSSKDLEIHHISRQVGNTLSNAQVLCKACHVKTPTYGKPGGNTTPFPNDIKEQALKRAGNKCECTTDRCH